MTATIHSSTDDLLKIFDSFSVKKDHVIPEQDLRFCEQQQELFYRTLDGIQRWYDIFCKEADKFAGSHAFSFNADGTVDFHEHYRGRSNALPDYNHFDFKPFEVINSLVKNRNNAIRTFAGNIIRYFNSKYSVSVPIPDMDDNIPLCSRPLYIEYVNLVEQHLQGRGFREMAEEEVIRRFHALACLSRFRSISTPQLKNDIIIFHALLRIAASYHASQPSHRLDYGHDKRLDTLCEGILFGSKTLLNGNSKIIRDFNYLNVDLNCRYSLTFENGYAMRFYQNGRIDVRFPDASKAKKCFERLRLNDIENLTGK